MKQLRATLTLIVIAYANYLTYTHGLPAWTSKLLMAITALTMCYIMIGAAYHIIHTHQQLPNPTTDTNKLLAQTVAIIPAHNEEATIAATLHDLRNAGIKAYVICDACTDHTATIALLNDAITIEGTWHSKTKALTAAIPEILTNTNYNYYLFLDADTRLEDPALPPSPQRSQQSRRTSCGLLAALADHDAVQARLLSYPLHFHGSLYALTRAYGQILWTAKATTENTSWLAGTGFILPRRTLTIAPWQPTTLTDDWEYSLTLQEKHLSAAYVENAIVYNGEPPTAKAGLLQRLRWARGTWQTVPKHPLGYLSSLLNIILLTSFTWCLVAPGMILRSILTAPLPFVTQLAITTAIMSIPGLITNRHRHLNLLAVPFVIPFLYSTILLNSYGLATAYDTTWTRTARSPEAIHV